MFVALQARAVCLSTFFGVKICIPSEQRDYLWPSKMAIDLVDCLLRAFNADQEMFLGSFALSKKLNSNDPYIYDGLQRLTTLNIMLLALWSFTHSKFGAENEKSVASLKELLFGGENDCGALGWNDEHHLQHEGQDLTAFNSMYKSQFAGYSQGDMEDSVSSIDFSRNFSELLKFLSFMCSTWNVTKCLDFAKFITKSQKIFVIRVQANSKLIQNIFRVLNSPGWETDWLLVGLVWLLMVSIQGCKLPKEI